MATKQRLTGVSHLFDVELTPVVINVTTKKRAQHVRSPDSVSVGLLNGRKPCIEIIRNLRDVTHSNVIVEISVYRIAQQSGLKFPLGKEVCNLSFGMNPGVCPTRAVDRHWA